MIRRAPGEFPPEVVELLQTFATQSALAIQNARLFREIEEKGRQLEVASQHKSQFLANMSHELRTPLNAILGYTELILDEIYGEVPEPIRDVSSGSGTSGQHLLGLINDVLDLSKIEAGQLTLSLDDYAMEEVVQAVVDARGVAGRREEARPRSAIVAAGPAAGPGRRAAARPGAPEPGRQRHQVHRGRRGPGRGDRARTARSSSSVADTGPGISEADQAEDLRGVPAGRQLQHPEEGRHRARALRSPSGSSSCTAGGSGWSRPSAEGSTFCSRVPVRVERQVAGQHEQAHPGGRGPGGEPAHPARPPDQRRLRDDRGRDRRGRGDGWRRRSARI